MRTLLLLALLTTLAADDAFRGAGITERIGARLPDDLALTDQDGRRTTLGELRGSLPLLLVPAYYHCPMLCGLALNGVAKGVEELGWPPGGRFRLAAFSFDPADDAASARERQADVLRRRWDPRNWPFLTADQPTISRMLDALGIRVARDGDQYSHAAVAVLLTPDGRISRYLYGIEFPQRDLRLALLEAADGGTRSTFDRVLLFCYHYDPAAHRYGFAIANFLRVGALAGALAAALGIVLLARARSRATA